MMDVLLLLGRQEEVDFITEVEEILFVTCCGSLNSISIGCYFAACTEERIWYRPRVKSSADAYSKPSRRGSPFSMGMSRLGFAN